MGCRCESRLTTPVDLPLTLHYPARVTQLPLPNGQHDLAICTWFVADTTSNATFFPQVVGRSDAPEVQAVYWRCVVCFYATSLHVNSGRRHIFFTNAPLPHLDGLNIALLFQDWGVEVVTLPIEHRLPAGTVSHWGNQFYIFDILDHLAVQGDAEHYIVLDSDCVWVDAADALDTAIARHGVLTYTLGADEHPIEQEINGLTRHGMARFLGRLGGPVLDMTPYYGGEIFAGTLAEIRRIVDAKPALWQRVLAQEADAPREEAHLLSILYALLAYSSDTANPFIRRIWTNFLRRNVHADDEALTIWHLPREKKNGFRDLFRIIADQVRLGAKPVDMPLTRALYRRMMGVPRRSPLKFIRDLNDKILEKLGG